MNPLTWLSENLPQMDADKRKVIEFVFLWQEYNYYYQKPYGHNGCNDKNRALALKDDKGAQAAYDNMKNEFVSSFSEIPSLVESNNPRTKLFINNESTESLEYHGNNKDSLENFLLVVYAIRCNFLHGEKLRHEDVPVDVKLIGWAKDSLEKLLTAIHFFN